MKMIGGVILKIICLLGHFYYKVFCILCETIIPLCVAVIRSVWGGDRPRDASFRLLLWPKIYIQPAGALLLRQAVVYYPSRCQILQLSEQVSVPNQWHSLNIKQSVLSNQMDQCTKNLTSIDLNIIRASFVWSLYLLNC